MKEILEKLTNHFTLTSGEAAQVLNEIAEGAYHDVEVVALMVALSMRSLTLAELQGFQEALMNHAVRIPLDASAAIDLCGTGGDGKDTFNVSTCAAMVVAGAGQAVVKHGNYGVSSRCGASNVLEELGVFMPATPEEVEAVFERCGAVFLHAPYFHPAMKRVAPLRKALRCRTFFNMLGPLVNPAQPAFQMTGTFSLSLQRLYSYFFQSQPHLLGYSVVHSIDGYDEISLTGDAKVCSSRGDTLYRPAHFQSGAIAEGDLTGGTTVRESADLFLRILQGEGTQAQQKVVCANAGLALYTCSAESLDDSLARAEESLASGAAYRVLQSLVEFQQEGV